MIPNLQKTSASSQEPNSAAKDSLKKAKQQKQQKTIQHINKQRFWKQWEVKIQGPSFLNYQFTIITESLFKVMNKAKDLVLASRQLAQILAAELGRQHWNVIIANGSFSKKTYASGGYFAVFERTDGTQAIIWLNKLTYQNFRDKSIVQESQYF